jgi:hypothetical protein
MRRLIGELMWWWEAQTQQKPDCDWNREAGDSGEYEGAFFHFAVAIIELVYGPNGYGKEIYRYLYPGARDKAIYRVVKEWQEKLSNLRQN